MISEGDVDRRPTLGRLDGPIRNWSSLGGRRVVSRRRRFSAISKRTTRSCARSLRSEQAMCSPSRPAHRCTRDSRSLPSSLHCRATSSRVPRPRGANAERGVMHLLILGGTSFVGRHIVETALAAGHRVTLFNRGTTDADLFAGRTTLVRGDRDVPGNVAQIADVGADAVVDVSGYTPDTVRASALAIRDSCARYAFVSSIDVFAYPNDAPDEDSPTKPLPDGAQTATQDLELYGAHKARCERDLVELLGPDRVFVALRLRRRAARRDRSFHVLAGARRTRRRGARTVRPSHARAAHRRARCRRVRRLGPRTRACRHLRRRRRSARAHDRRRPLRRARCDRLRRALHVGLRAISPRAGCRRVGRAPALVP